MSIRSQIIEQLRSRVKELQCDHHRLGETVSTGCKDFDALLHGGLARGSLVEWVGPAGCGKATLALLAAKQACQEKKILIVVDRQREFYAPAAQALGIDLERTFVVQPQNTPDYHWSLNQIFRSGGVAAVVCWPEKVNEKMLRRWQLAAENGGTLGFLIRPPTALKEPTWAKVRLLVEALSSRDRSRRWLVTVLDSLSKRTIELEMNDETGTLQKARPLPVAAPLATGAGLQRSTGA